MVNSFFYYSHSPQTSKIINNIVTTVLRWGNSALNNNIKNQTFTFKNERSCGYYDIEIMNAALKEDFLTLPSNIIEPDDIEKWLMSNNE